MYVRASNNFLNFYFISVCKKKTLFKIFRSYILITWIILKQIDRS